MNLPILPLKAAMPIEALESWEKITSPSDLINYLVRNLGVDPSQLTQFQELYFSSIEPSGTDRGKLWIKTDGYPGIGIFIGDTYKIIGEYPPNVPLLWTRPAGEFPSYLTKITEEQMETYGLTLPDGSTLFYFMLIQ